MVDKNNHQNRESSCLASSGIGTKLMFFMIGGGIGAAIALLFAPKAGRELRDDIADMAGKGYNETLAVANQVKQQTAEYYQTAKETGSEVLDVVAAGVSAVKEEVSNDVEKVGAIVQNTARVPSPVENQ